LSKTINTPVTVLDLFRLAQELDMRASEVIDMFDDALGTGWWEREPEELTLRGVGTLVAEDWDPHLNEWQRPAPGLIPPGFEPLNAEWDIFVGKSMWGARWKVISEYSLHANEFSLTFWTTDDDAMTAAETREYTAALLEMTSYITTKENIMAKNVEAGK